ncbi:ethanolamine ammonia-lyase subunit EutC [Spirosoma sp. KCTC 42546]|uniref:ethanolamine ammonia-lyase subunit EutC n=1 Tax=Spirosoma sp. KCTC 42546 TaxID=2520506 RepID=UPI00115B678F|nr:ethanolamine ammonia-lyase subunit EutC [Spirosoma sp. KCTC 42546]QDK79241.1 ethanolamine ammonia-lyase subunit EutC [Spirosoma sp. KCTC 42546]
MNELKKTGIEADDWEFLKAYTTARIALGKTGVSIPLKESLQFKMAHAHAKDAVYSSLDMAALQADLSSAGLPIYTVHSQAENRDIYLQRPDLGRLLSADSAEQLQQLNSPSADISIIIADGLSATAIMENAVPVVRLLVEKAQQAGYALAPILLVDQGRVAITDAIGGILNPRLAIMLIGERPGLSSFDSMGAYITYGPQPGLTDERRNCISNIRQQGLSPAFAVDKLMYLIQSAFRLQITGVALKDNGDPEQDRILLNS